MEYVVDCECSEEIGVELYQAGASVTCPACQRPVTVPSTTKLKQRAGDAHPLANRLQRAMIAVREREPPFDGVCQTCGERPATIQQPVRFQFLEERRSDNDGGFQLNLLGGVDLVRSTPAAEEWCSLDFPLLFCQTCYDRFHRHANRTRLLSIPFKLLAIGGMILLAAFLIGVAFVMPYIGIALAIFIFWRIFDAARRQRGDATLRAYVSELQWIGDVVKREEESVLKLGRARYIAEGGHTAVGETTC